MTFWLLVIPTLCYAAASLAYAVKANWPLSIMYAGYAFANCGALWLDRMMR